MEQLVGILVVDPFGYGNIHLENQAVHNQAVVVVLDLWRTCVPGPWALWETSGPS